MGKKLFMLIMAVFLTVTFSFTAYAFKCKVKKLENGKLTAKCKISSIKKYALKTGDKLEVRKALEGC
jgi:hypothetical protein